jgi:hypothetical protein
MKNRNLLLDLSKRISLILNKLLYGLMALSEFVMLSFESIASIIDSGISFNGIQNSEEVSMILEIDIYMEIHRKYG